MKIQGRLSTYTLSRLKQGVSFLGCLLIAITCVNAQAELEPLKALFPSSIEAFETYGEPEIARVKVNGEYYYNIVQRYEINIDTSFTVRLTDYRKEPEFIQRMVKEFGNASPYEDESEKWSYVKLLGYPTQLEVIKKYPTFNFTTVVVEKAWLITFSGNGINQEQATKYLTAILQSLLNQ